MAHSLKYRKKTKHRKKNKHRKKTKYRRNEKTKKIHYPAKRKISGGGDETREEILKIYKQSLRKILGVKNEGELNNCIDIIRRLNVSATAENLNKISLVSEYDELKGEMDLIISTSDIPSSSSAEIRAEQVEEEVSHREDRLRGLSKELMDLKPSALVKRAEAENVPLEQLDAARDGENPREEIVALIVTLIDARLGTAPVDNALSKIQGGFATSVAEERVQEVEARPAGGELVEPVPAPLPRPPDEELVEPVPLPRPPDEELVQPAPPPGTPDEDTMFSEAVKAAAYAAALQAPAVEGKCVCPPEYSRCDLSNGWCLNAADGYSLGTGCGAAYGDSCSMNHPTFSP